MNEHTKRRALIITIILSLIPSILLMKFPALVTVKTVSLYLSAIFGYMGIVMLLWIYILGTKSVFGLLFYDLAPILRIHKLLGKYASPLILLHPILITIGYGEQWFYSFVPKTSTLFERHILLGQISLAVLALTVVLSVYFKKRMEWRIWRYIHYIAYMCVPFALLHVPDLGTQEQANAIVKGYLFVLALTFIVFALIRLRTLLNLEKFAYSVVRHTQLTELDYMMKLRPIGHQALAPRRGQYIYIKLGFLSEDHPFSITQYTESTGEITVTYRIAGMYTKELQKLPSGSEVLVSGPYGSFTEDLAADDPTPVVYIAGGIGVTPFVDRILSEGTSREQWLFAANRSRKLAVLYDPLKAKLGTHAVAVYPHATTAKPGEETGYVTTAMLKKHLSDPHVYRYYICGPSAMMTAVREVIIALGVPASQVQTEKFGW